MLEQPQKSPKGDLKTTSTQKSPVTTTPFRGRSQSNADMTSRPRSKTPARDRVRAAAVQSQATTPTVPKSVSQKNSPLMSPIRGKYANSVLTRNEGAVSLETAGHEGPKSMLPNPAPDASRAMRRQAAAERNARAVKAAVERVQRGRSPCFAAKSTSEEPAVANINMKPSSSEESKADASSSISLTIPFEVDHHAGERGDEKNQRTDQIGDYKLDPPNLSFSDSGTGLPVYGGGLKEPRSRPSRGRELLARANFSVGGMSQGLTPSLSSPLPPPRPPPPPPSTAAPVMLVPKEEAKVELSRGTSDESAKVHLMGDNVDMGSRGLSGQKANIARPPTETDGARSKLFAPPTHWLVLLTCSALVFVCGFSGVTRGRGGSLPSAWTPGDKEEARASRRGAKAFHNSSEIEPWTNHNTSELQHDARPFANDSSDNSSNTPLQMVALVVEQRQQRQPTLVPLNQQFHSKEADEKNAFETALVPMTAEEAMETPQPLISQEAGYVTAVFIDATGTPADDGEEREGKHSHQSKPTVAVKASTDGLSWTSGSPQDTSEDVRPEKPEKLRTAGVDEIEGGEGEESTESEGGEEDETNSQAKTEDGNEQDDDEKGVLNRELEERRHLELLAQLRKETEIVLASARAEAASAIASAAASVPSFSPLGPAGGASSAAAAAPTVTGAKNEQQPRPAPRKVNHGYRRAPFVSAPSASPSSARMVLLREFSPVYSPERADLAEEEDGGSEATDAPAAVKGEKRIRSWFVRAFSSLWSDVNAALRLTAAAVFLGMLVF